MRIQQLIEPSLLQRFLGKPNKKNVLVELNNLFASSSIDEIKQDDINTILQKYKIKSLSSFQDGCKNIYTELLNDYLADNSISQEDEANLSIAKTLLQIDDNEAKTIHINETLKVYKEFYFAAISETKVSEKSNEFLTRLSTNLTIDNEILEKRKNEWNKEFIDSLINQIIAQGKLSPEDEAKLVKTAKTLNIGIADNSEILDKLSDLREIWEIENGELRKIDAPLLLNKNEFCYALSVVDWLESRTITKRVNYGGPTMRLKIAKGLYYSAGSLNVQRITEDILQHIDSGVLYLTNRRLILVGAKKTLNVKLDKILNITSYSDGIEIVKDTGRSPIIKLHDNPKMFRLILARLLSEIKE